MPKQRKRYYSDDDFEAGVTPSQLKRLGRTKQIEYMKHWFFRNFEDPANETPHDSGEGGYIYIWGGPYDAREELSDEFGDLVSEETLEQIIEEVQSDGTYDWAPGPDHPDQKRRQEEWESEQEPEREYDIEEIIARLQAGAKPNYGNPHELAERRVILDRLNQMEETIRTLRPSHGGIGHNNPPPDDDDETGEAGLIVEIQDASAVIREELSKTAPDALAVGLATSRLQKVMSWFGKKFDIAAESFAKSAGDAAGKAAGAAIVTVAAAYTYSPLGELISGIVRQTTEWLHNITLPF